MLLIAYEVCQLQSDGPALGKLYVIYSWTFLGNMFVDSEISGTAGGSCTVEQYISRACAAGADCSGVEWASLDPVSGQRPLLVFGYIFWTIAADVRRRPHSLPIQRSSRARPRAHDHCSRIEYLACILFPRGHFAGPLNGTCSSVFMTAALHVNYLLSSRLRPCDNWPPSELSKLNIDIWPPARMFQALRERRIARVTRRAAGERPEGASRRITAHHEV